MKPIKNRFFCVDAGKAKMLFKSESSAKRFMDFNAEEISEEGENKKPIRAYFCIACGGWHVTSQPEPNYHRKSKTERYFEKHEIIYNAVEKRKKMITDFVKCITQYRLDGKKTNDTASHITLLHDKAVTCMNNDERMKKQLLYYIPIFEKVKELILSEEVITKDNMVKIFDDIPVRDNAAYIWRRTNMELYLINKMS